MLNSLYGRFGMNDNFDNINIIHKDYYNDFENKYLDQITEKIEIDDYITSLYSNKIRYFPILFFFSQTYPNSRNFGWSLKWTTLFPVFIQYLQTLILIN